MTTREGSLGERVARIEGELQHVATKADVERLRADVQRGLLGLAGLIVAVGAVILAALRLWS